jgi:hypothetical protein
MVLGDLRVDQFTAVSLETCKRPLFVRSHKPAVAGHIGGKDRAASLRSTRSDATGKPLCLMREPYPKCGDQYIAGSSGRGPAINSVALVTIRWKMSPETCREISRFCRATASRSVSQPRTPTMNDNEAHPTANLSVARLRTKASLSVLNRRCVLATSGRSGPSCRWKGAREFSHSSTLPQQVAGLRCGGGSSR